MRCLHLADGTVFLGFLGADAEAVVVQLLISVL